MNNIQFEWINQKQQLQQFIAELRSKEIALTSMLTDATPQHQAFDFYRQLQQELE